MEEQTVPQIQKKKQAMGGRMTPKKLCPAVCRDRDRNRHRCHTNASSAIVHSNQVSLFRVLKLTIYVLKLLISPWSQIQMAAASILRKRDYMALIFSKALMFLCRGKTMSKA